MSDENPTIFGKILRGELPANKVFEDEHCVAFRDINPAAPTHILIIPRVHLPTINDAKSEHKEVIGHLVLCAAQIARDEGIAEDGYRLVINCNNDGGQTVYHLHMHILGGRRLGWPPG